MKHYKLFGKQPIITFSFLIIKLKSINNLSSQSTIFILIFHCQLHKQHQIDNFYQLTEFKKCTALLWLINSYYTFASSTSRKLFFELTHMGFSFNCLATPNFSQLTQFNSQLTELFQAWLHTSFILNNVFNTFYTVWNNLLL